MEFLEALFDMFGESLTLNYFRWIESCFPDEEVAQRRCKIFKSIAMTVAAALFVTTFVGLFLIALGDGSLKIAGIAIFVFSAFCFILYDLIGYILKRRVKRKQKHS